LSKEEFKSKSIDTIVRLTMHNEAVGEPTEDDLKNYRIAAKKMVDNIEDRRKIGAENAKKEYVPYSAEERTELEDAFYNNMIKMKKGEL